LTPELNRQEAKDAFYHIEVEVPFLLAVQDPETTRPYIYKKTPWGSIERVEARTDGTPTALTAPKRKKNVRTGEVEIKTGPCFSFRTVNGDIHLPWGGPFGVLKQGLRRTLDSKNKAKYDTPKLDLMKIYPRIVKIPGPIDSQTKGKNPTVVLTTRHTAKGDVMVNEFFDYIQNKAFDFYMEVDSGCPVNKEKFVELIKGLNTLDTFGASKRGEVKVRSIKIVAPFSDEEIRKLEKA
jgi:hypothetical protein